LPAAQSFRISSGVAPLRNDCSTTDPRIVMGQSIKQMSALVA
jgi:hypothetical protein